MGLAIQIPSHAPAARAASPPVASIGAKTLPATKTVQVPLVVCSTEFGMKPSHLPKLPTHLYLKVSSQVGRGAAVYTDKLGQVRVVGPRGWWCGASVGVDGSDNVKVYPVGGPTQKSGVTANETSACVGCTLEQACRLFPGAKTLLRSEYKESCASRPRAEIVNRVNAHIVYFDDPSGVAGDGAMSGGANPAVGVMTTTRRTRARGERELDVHLYISRQPASPLQRRRGYLRDLVPVPVGDAAAVQD